LDTHCGNELADSSNTREQKARRRTRASLANRHWPVAFASFEPIVASASLPDGFTTTLTADTSDGAVVEMRLDHDRLFASYSNLSNLISSEWDFANRQISVADALALSGFGGLGEIFTKIPQSQRSP
jgi:hypothetical protein